MTMNETHLVTQAELQASNENIVALLKNVATIILSIELLVNQAGFALLETGSIRERHLKSVMAKNLLDLTFGTLSWYLVGYGVNLQFSEKFAGQGYATNDVQLFPDLFKNTGFALTMNTVLSGAIAGRMKLSGFIIIVIYQCALVYPVLSGLAWHSWLAEKGYKDFAGGMVVHGTGGVMAFLGAFAVGPRYDRFDDDREDGVYGGVRFYKGVREIAGSSASLRILGTLLLWLSWFNFNAVSAFSLEGVQGVAETSSFILVSRAVVTTLVSSASGCVCGTLTVRALNRYYDIDDIAISLLAGCVSITSGAGYVPAWSAVLIGAIGAWVCFATKYLVLYKCRIDDPLHAVALHFGCGLWGAIAVGLFDEQDGLFISGAASLLVVQIYGSLILICITVVSGVLVLSVLHCLRGLNVDQVYEIVGIDMRYHDGFKLDDDFGPEQILEYNRRRDALKTIKEQHQSPRRAGVSATQDDEFDKDSVRTWSGKLMRHFTSTTSSFRGTRSRSNRETNVQAQAEQAEMDVEMVGENTPTGIPCSTDNRTEENDSQQAVST